MLGEEGTIFLNYAIRFCSFLWSQRIKRIEETIYNTKDYKIVHRGFKGWKAVTDKKILLRERHKTFQALKKKEAWQNLYQNYQVGRKLDEMNRLARRFRYHQSLKKGFNQLRQHITIQRTRVQIKNEASKHLQRVLEKKYQ